ncbi:hypothetical protein TPA0910_82210 [Streptomyces hygroscopicus subsp. sporocinereus]|uniref:Uncharacterized protein n=1 Tax=Streptomyces hygroscopicus TaxID=1912 RepID=A0ABQ3UF36_STRHY|nr:hypothetical protein TPA0910_82210 [Streptomyces hygroscopicus]
MGGEPGRTARLRQSFPGEHRSAPERTGEQRNDAGPQPRGSIRAESVWTVMRTGAKVVASSGDSPVPGWRA